ncbi:MAG: vWA domain-containing protein [Roseibacillus sp.]
MNSVISPEVEAALKRQKARATLSSLLISILAVVLVGILLFLVAIQGINLTQPDVVAYQASSQDDQQIEQKQINPSVQRKPSAPSSSMAKVIAANTVSPTAIPVPEVDMPVESIEFGDGDDFGAGWGSGGGSSGGGGTTFFGQKSSAERIAFVIDYSLSMNAQQRVEIMKVELSKSLKDLTPGTQYQMIFFAGPAWVAGSKVADVRGSRNNVFTGLDGKKYEWANGKPKGKKQRAEWLTVPTTDGLIGSERRDAEKKQVVLDSLKHVKETPLVLGTRWDDALEMAMDMDPRPQVIYFMTDGTTGGDTAMDTAKSVGNKAKSRKIIVNCIAMMEPKAAEAMKELAKRASGKFTMVEKGGKVKEIPVD